MIAGLGFPRPFRSRWDREFEAAFPTRESVANPSWKAPLTRSAAGLATDAGGNIGENAIVKVDNSYILSTMAPPGAITRRGP